MYHALIYSNQRRGQSLLMGGGQLMLESNLLMDSGNTELKVASDSSS